jgi:hypothetical protein
MTRHKALRMIGCDWLTAVVINTLNKIAGVPQGEIRFMHITIEYDTKGQP